MAECLERFADRVLELAFFTRDREHELEIGMLEVAGLAAGRAFAASASPVGSPVTDFAGAGAAE